MARNTIQTYYTTDTLAPIADGELLSLKTQLQGVYQYNGGTMGEMGNARTSVKRINAILRARGVLKDAKAAMATADTTGLIAAAVAPLKAAAMDYAEEQAAQNFADALRRVEAADWNLDTVAPSPKSTESKYTYRAKKSARAFISALFSIDAARTEDAQLANRKAGNFRDQPVFLKLDMARRAKYLAEERAGTGLDFDAYVIKLEGKVGSGVTAASIDAHRRYLQQGSTLTVTKGSVVERWYSQQIINRSVLGKLFNQWPTRKVK